MTTPPRSRALFSTLLTISLGLPAACNEADNGSIPSQADALLDAGNRTASADSSVRVLTGFSTPESAHWHAASASWYVTNIAGETGVADGEGWITRLDEDLNVLEQKWLEGLDSPAGITSNDSTLFVADINQVLAINIRTTTVSEAWLVADALLLNDTALHRDGSVYVSDTFGEAVYRVQVGEKPKKVLQDPQLDGPNGLHLRGDLLTIASSGSFTDFEEEASIFQFELTTGMLTKLDKLSGKFDGIETYGDGLLVSDFRGQLLELDSELKAIPLRNFVKEGYVSTTADLGFDPERGRVALPDLIGDRVLFYDIN